MRSVPESLRRAAAAHFALLGAAVAAWWAWLALVPARRAGFFPEGTPDPLLRAFAAPDLLLLAGGSIVAAVMIARSHPWAVPAVWAISGAWSYATLLVLAWAAFEGSGWLGFVAMGPASLLAVNWSIALTSADVALFRPAAPGGRHLARTLVQLAAFWIVLLALVPWGLHEVSRDLGLTRSASPASVALGSALFAACSALGIRSAVVMASRGEGTPLPFDAARRLVTSGPYAWVRNPMAVAGIGQGLGVAIALQDVLLLAYVALGAYVWHVIVRPPEEADLEERFGEPYRAYRREVRCWLPRRPPR